MNGWRQTTLLAMVCTLVLQGFSPAQEGQVGFVLRSRVPTELNQKWHQFNYRSERWQADETAIIVCDFWDYHHCLNAVKRMKEFGPRLNRVIQNARSRGMTIIHSPSDCMDAYQDHPARLRVTALRGTNSPKNIKSWCSKIPGEERAIYPIDQSDGGEDDLPKEHQRWAEQLSEMGRNPKMPWKKQNDMIGIDEEQDFISDKGDEVWNVLKSRKIKNVILVGVHANMCVLGRPFGLRQMKQNGMNVVLMRDMTDTMYNPARWPYVSHYCGTDLVVSHIEKYVCPTISSDQLIGGNEFSFASDTRPHLAIVVGEREYKTEQTLPDFAEKHLRDFRVTFVHANDDDRNDFPGIEQVADADVMLLSVRRRVLKPAQMKVFRDFEAAGKPMLGIRTASHAFSLRKQNAPDGYQDWKEFDGSVFGGAYTNHYGNQLKSRVTYTEQAINHPITQTSAVEQDTQKATAADLKVFGQGGSLYKTSPLAQGTTVLMTGTVLGQPAEPVAWTFSRVNDGKSFYTSLGHPEDFANPEFIALLKNAIFWAVSKENNGVKKDAGARWTPVAGIQLPNRKQIRFEFESKKDLSGLHARLAFRKVIRIPKSWEKNKVVIRTGAGVEKAWLNGAALEKSNSDNEFVVAAESVEFGDANWLTLGVKFYADDKQKESLPVVFKLESEEVSVRGAWEWRQADDRYSQTSRIALPAKFGGSTDVFVDLEEE